MTITLRIPTQEQYAYVEITLDEDIIDPNQVRNIYDEYTIAFRDRVGLPQNEWNSVLDSYREGKGMTAEQNEKMSKVQAWMIHELDKSDNRK